MTKLIKVITLQPHTDRTKKQRHYTYYTVAVPSRFMKELGWKAKDALLAEVREMRIGGKKRKVLIYYRVD